MVQRYLREGVKQAWLGDEGPTVRLIGAVIATVLEAQGQAVPGLDEQIEAIRSALPNAAKTLDLIERERRQPRDARLFVREALPFNFR